MDLKLQMCCFYFGDKRQYSFSLAHAKLKIKMWEHPDLFNFIPDVVFFQVDCENVMILQVDFLT